MIPWDRLGLASLLAVDGRGALLLVDGEPRPTSPLPNAPLVEVRYGGGEGGAIDLLLLAQTLFPTLPDHRLPTVAGHLGIAADEKAPREVIALLLPLLLAGALSLDPGLVSLLGELLPPPTGSVLHALVPFAGAAPAKTEAQAAIEPTPVTSLAAAWTPDGPIARGLPAFEARVGQVEMSERVHEALEQGKTLAVEAGPGTGKTFAYLIPAILLLRDGKIGRLVVSTRTKTLQEQLFLKDLPFLIHTLAPRLRVALLKGRENYLCLRRWQGLVGELTGRLEADRLAALAPVARWLFQTETGDIDENQAFLSGPDARDLWHRLRDDPRHCIAPVCPFAATECHSLAARRRAREADLVVVNHALLLANARAGGMILGEYGHLVVDEAHALEGAARQAFTSTLSERTLDLLLSDVEPTRHPPGWLGRVPLAPDDRAVVRARDLVTALRGMNARLFADLGRALPAEARGRTPALDVLSPHAQRLAETLTALRTDLEGIAASLDEEGVRHEADGLLGGLDEAAALASSLLLPPPEGRVHWYERTNGEASLASSPLEVAELLGEALYARLEGLVLTSATLSLGGSFDYLAETLGLARAPGETTTAVVEGAFSYGERMRAYLADFLPPVDGPVEAYADALALLLGEVARATGRKTLALFTSYALLHAVRERLSGAAEVLTQGVDGPRGKVIERFRRSAGGTILLGTDSFWEGVDLPGKDLEILVVTRLPFPVPTDPILSALGEALERRGRDPFLDLALPQALLKLRQGVGRLIRTRSDRGAVIVTDRRILEKSYGRKFAASLPVPGERVTSLQDLVLDLGAWFDYRPSHPP
jgi:ATP-dependent DNA helicase DinG